MSNSAQIRRSITLRRIFRLPTRVCLATPRPGWDRVVHLTCMNNTSEPFPGLEPVLTTSELAAHLGVPVQTIHDLRHARRGPRGFRVGRELRYRVSEVQVWLAELEEPSAPADGDDR
ncbi:helix-turn-helix transcriptional regulator [Microbacterium rhizophilus]|uniref:helix-turn-helix transcriptional regulator n=1 Tax=Microbacterium rhizophilus TaxID=3138934 RepID=UPI0031E6D96A